MHHLSIPTICLSLLPLLAMSQVLDCGGGRAPPKTTVPGCPLYAGPGAATADISIETIIGDSGDSETVTEVPATAPTFAPMPTGVDGSDESEDFDNDGVDVAPTHTSDIADLSTGFFSIAGSGLASSFLDAQMSATADGSTVTGTAFGVVFFPSGVSSSGSSGSEATGTVLTDAPSSSSSSSLLPGIVRISGVNGQNGTTTTIRPTGSGASGHASSSPSSRSNSSVSVTASGSAPTSSASASGNGTAPKTNGGARVAVGGGDKRLIYLGAGFLVLGVGILV